MSSHWTYDSTFPPEKSDDIQQGDILQPSEQLRSVFEAVHPHFCDPKYQAFVVLTQTCDLVRRDGQPCRSRYINLAVVRPLRIVIDTFLEKYCTKLYDAIYASESKTKARMFLARLFNQNEQLEGLFYLHQDADVGILEPAVALLQVSIAVRSRDHYATVAAARTGRLNREFQNRLGWLVGYLFSRVPTQDWPENQLRKMVDATLKDAAAASLVSWVPGECKAAAEAAKISLDDLPTKEVLQILNDHQPKPVKEAVVERILQIASDKLPSLDTQDKEKLRNYLTNDMELRQILKRSGF